MLPDVLEEIADDFTEESGIDVDSIQQIWNKLPEQAMHLGIRVVLALLVFMVGLQLIKLIRRILRKALERGHADQGVTHFLDSLVRTILMVVLIFMIASGFGLDAASVATVLGTVGVAIGLAIQGSLSNLAGGVLIMLLKPFKVGDYIKEDTHGNEGSVISIDIIYTKLKTPDNRVIILPNGTLANSSLTNATACEERRMDLRIPVSYDTDLKAAKAAMLKVLENELTVLKEQEYMVYVEELTTGYMMMGVRCWFSTEDYWEGMWRVNEQIKYALDGAGIHIPGTQVEVRMAGVHAEIPADSRS